MSKNSTIKTRFAPSPTGGLHVGSIKTALINYLFAKKHGGQFLLRIEDTDKERSKQDYVKHIEDGLHKLGFHHDGDICYQSQNDDHHARVANQLLESGNAYKCYATLEEIESFKTSNPGKKFVSKWRDIPHDSTPDKSNKASFEHLDKTDRASLDRSYVVRLKASHEGSTKINDMVQGEIEVSNTELDDMILLRSNGSPTYMLAVVVDDFDMGITHVIRGTDHLTNTFRQIQIYNAMGWETPKFMHIPLMHGEDGHKLSKRHGAVTLDELLDEGYLIEAIINYLLLLGAGFDKPEIFDLNYAIEYFDYTKASKSPARFDYSKLKFVNSQHINNLSDDNILKYLDSHIKELSSDILQKIKHGMPLIKERAELMLNTISLAMLFKEPANPMDTKSKDVIDTADSRLLSVIHDFLQNIEFENKEVLMAEIKAFAKAREIKFPKILQILRATILGTFASPGIIDMMMILGKSESLKRLAKYI